MKTPKNKRPVFSLRFRLVLVVAVELVASVFLAAWISDMLQNYLPSDWEIPMLLYLTIVSLLVGSLVTTLLSRLFFAPIKKLSLAMSRVAEGDFTVQLQTKTKSREILDIYAGFNLMTQELRSTEILQSDFVANVSHEFKTPLSAIEGYSTLLQDCDNLTPQQQEYVEKIVGNTQRLSSLAGSILLLSKLENQQIPTNQSRFFLDEQILLTVVDLEPEWEKKGIEFDVQMDRTEYYGCQGLMSHVWSNLLSNAIKFSPVEGTISLRLFSRDNQIHFAIKDEGPGIPKEAISRIFGKFYQADSSHKQEGNGLGLSLVKEILQLEKGSIAAENCLDGGCCFTVLLEKRT